MRTEIVKGRGQSVIELLMGVFRVNFFKKKGRRRKQHKTRDPPRQTQTAREL